MSQMKYLKSAVHPVDFPPPDRPEVAVAGRSNAGKSSFLNVIAKSKVAHVSQTPGKTRLLNFFDFGQHYRFVDMPGYGFAARSGDEIVDWTKMIETYLSVRENLRGLILIMDARRDWSKDEEILKKFCNKINLPICLVLTKSDKCSNKERAGFLKKIKADSQLAHVFMTSAQTLKGIETVEEFIYRDWILDPEKESL